MAAGVLSKVKAGLLWARMRRKYLQGDFGAARELADAHKKTGVESIVFDAFDATLDVLNHRYDTAAEKFSAVADRTKDDTKVDVRYIHEYARYSLCLHENLRRRAERHRQAALSLDASAVIRRALPLPSNPLPAE